MLQWFLRVRPDLAASVAGAGQMVGWFIQMIGQQRRQRLMSLHYTNFHPYIAHRHSSCSASPTAKGVVLEHVSGRWHLRMQDIVAVWITGRSCWTRLARWGP